MDTDDWRRAAAGDPDAFAALFRRHAKKVLNHCFRKTGSWSIADDLTAAVFLETWRRRDGVVLSETGSLLPWLLGVANNLSRNHARARRRYQCFLDRLPIGGQDSADFSDSVVEKIDAETKMRRVREALGQLSVHETEVLELCVWAGLTYAEAALTLGVPVGTVRSRLSRARQHLQDISTGPSPQDLAMPPRSKVERQ